jgi:hypothetical protein
MRLGETLRVANYPANLNLREVKLALDYLCRHGYVRRAQPEVEFGLSPSFAKLLDREASAPAAERGAA